MAARQVINGTFSGTGTSLAVGAFTPLPGVAFNVTLQGAFTGSVQPEVSYDNGSTWSQITNLGTAVAYTAPCAEALLETEPGALYRLNCTALSAGTPAFRISQ